MLNKEIEAQLVARVRQRAVDKPKRGRPATARGPYNPHPARQLGRVSDADWQALQDAARAAGKTFTAWAVETLLRRAKRQ